MLISPQCYPNTGSPIPRIPGARVKGEFKAPRRILRQAQHLSGNARPYVYAPMLGGGGPVHLLPSASIPALARPMFGSQLNASMSIRRRCFGVAAAVILAVSWSPGTGQAAFAADVAVQKDAQDPCKERIIEGYEPNTFGYTKQADDEGFADFKISIKSQLFRDWICRKSAARNRLYFTFTGRFGFYIRTRYSSPVVAKNYNPKLVWRVIPDPKNDVVPHLNEYSQYIEFAYAHDSNGQSIDSLQEFEVQASQHGSARDALDYVSRGWDYVQVTGKKSFSQGRWVNAVLTAYPDLKFFLRHGLFEGVPEEYHSWEQDTTLRPRHAFDGISTAVEYRPFALRHDSDSGLVRKSSLRMEVKYMTGYDPVARYNTIRGELGIDVQSLPITLWVQDGYMNSLARYYKRTRSVGVELRFAEF